MWKNQNFASKDISIIIFSQQKVEYYVLKLPQTFSQSPILKQWISNTTLNGSISKFCNFPFSSNSNSYPKFCSNITSCSQHHFYRPWRLRIQTMFKPDLYKSHSSSLFQQFLIQSSHSKFYETSIYNDHTGPLSGRFQFRNYLSQSECKNCMKNFPELSKNLCGSKIAARIQLSGCYIHYQADGVETSWVQLLHKSCSKYKVKKCRFEDVKDEAFAALQRRVLSGSGFYETTYEFIHVIVQCEESLGGFSGPKVNIRM